MRLQFENPTHLARLWLGLELWEKTGGLAGTCHQARSVVSFWELFLEADPRIYSSVFPVGP